MTSDCPVVNPTWCRANLELVLETQTDILGFSNVFQNQNVPSLKKAEHPVPDLIQSPGHRRRSAQCSGRV